MWTSLKTSKGPIAFGNEGEIKGFFCKNIKIC